MSEEWPSHYARNQVRVLLIPTHNPSRYYCPQSSLAAVDQGPPMFPNAPPDRHSMTAITRQCACRICTGSTSNVPPTWYTSATNHQNWDVRPPSVGTVSLKDASLLSDS